MKIKKSIIGIIVFFSILVLIFLCSFILEKFNSYQIRLQTKILLLEKQNRAIADIRDEIRYLDSFINNGDSEKNIILFIKTLRTNSNIESIRLALDWSYYNANISINEQVHPGEEVCNYILELINGKPELIIQTLKEDKQVYKDVFIDLVLMDIKDNKKNRNCIEYKKILKLFDKWNQDKKNSIEIFNAISCYYKKNNVKLKKKVNIKYIKNKKFNLNYEEFNELSILDKAELINRLNIDEKTKFIKLIFLKSTFLLSPNKLFRFVNKGLLINLIGFSENPETDYDISFWKHKGGKIYLYKKKKSVAVPKYMKEKWEIKSAVENNGFLELNVKVTNLKENKDYNIVLTYFADSESSHIDKYFNK